MSEAPSGTSRRVRRGGVMVRRAIHDSQVRTLVFSFVFGLYAWLQAAGYRGTYPNLADRVAFAQAFANNASLRLFYGYPYDVVSIGGYSAWRVGGVLSIAAATYGVMSAVRALRAEEEAGRSELVLAGVVRRSSYFLSSVFAMLVGAVTLGIGEFVGYLIGGLSARASAYAALSTALVIPAFAGLGALASQVAPTRRGALALSMGAVGLAWLMRMVADTWSPGSWLRFATPLGWAEAMRPFTGSVVGFALPSLGLALVGLIIAGTVSRYRDVGVGLAPPRDTARARRAFLSGPTRQFVRVAKNSLASWVIGFGVFAFVLGMVSTSISDAGVSPALRQELANLGMDSVFTPTGYLSFVFVIFIVALSYFVSAQLSAARQEETDQVLETLLAQPVDRRYWLAGRQAVATLGAAGLALEVSLLAWAGAAVQGVDVSLGHLLEAGANALPTTVLFLGVTSLVFSVMPRASSAVNYSLASVAFLWYIVGALVHVPHWLIEATPYQHIGFVPVESFRTVPALVMLVSGVLGSGIAVLLFRRRDLQGG